MSTFTLVLPSQALDRAADVIVRNGWTRDEFFAPADGRAPSACRVDAVGAICVAAGRHPEFATEPYEHTTVPLSTHADDPAEWTLAGPDAEAMEVVHAAVTVFARHLRQALGFDRPLPDEVLIAWWNDDPARTAGEVVREMYAAAAAAGEAGR